MNKRLIDKPSLRAMFNTMDHRTRTVLRRSSEILLIVGLLSSIGVFLGHHWFHNVLLLVFQKLLRNLLRRSCISTTTGCRNTLGTKHSDIRTG